MSAKDKNSVFSYFEKSKVIFVLEVILTAWSNYFWPTGHFTKARQLAGHFQ